MKIYIGIDPGKSGGVCFLNGDDIRVCKCPATIHDMVNEIEIANDIGVCSAVVEKVHSMPGQGVRSVWTFTENYAHWCAILATLKVRYVLVPPYTWMKFYGSMPKDKRKRKNYLKQLAQQLYPNIKVTLATADAILLAHYLQQTDAVEAVINGNSSHTTS